jgi:hypothetical protein
VAKQPKPKVDAENAYIDREAGECGGETATKARKPKKTAFRKYAITPEAIEILEQAKEKRPTHMGYTWNTNTFGLFYSEAEAKKWKKHELAERPYAAVHIGKIIQ